MRAASQREKLSAASIDAAVAIFGFVLVMGLGVGAAVAFANPERGRRRRDAPDEDRDDKANPAANALGDGDRSDHQDDRPRGTRYRLGELLRSGALDPAIRGAGVGLAIAGRNWRSPGSRVIGLRRVNARTGGPIGLRSALIGVSFDQARQAAGTLFRPRADRARDRTADLAPQLKEIQRTYAADGEGRQRAIEELYEANRVNPSAGCGWQVAGLALWQSLLAATAIRDGRTIYDHLTGTIVVTDR